MTDESLEAVRRHFDVVAEGLSGQMRQVAEGVSAVQEQLTAFREATQTELLEVKSMVRLSFAELDRRVTSLERTTSSLAIRLERLESSAQ